MEEEDGLQVLTRAWARQETPRHSTPIRRHYPHSRHANYSTPEHTLNTTRRRANHGSQHHHRQQCHPDVRHVDPLCSRRTRSLDPSSGDTMGRCTVSLQRIPTLDAVESRERTYQCPDASCRIQQTQMATTTGSSRPKWRQQRSGHTCRGQCSQEQKDELGRDSRMQANHRGPTQTTPPTRRPEAGNRGRTRRTRRPDAGNRGTTRTQQ